MDSLWPVACGEGMVGASVIKSCPTSWRALCPWCVQAAISEGRSSWLFAQGTVCSPVGETPATLPLSGRCKTMGHRDGSHLMG